jgi:hypothetical protein
VKLIPVHYKGEAVVFAKVDDDDYDNLAGYKWHVDVDDWNIYARRHVPEGRHYHTRYMHQDVMGVQMRPTLRTQVDHINHIGLDNTRSNLRICTSQGNQLNRRKSKKSKSSKYIGVSINRRLGKWETSVTLSGKRVFYGMFESETQARNAYKLAKPIIINKKYALDRVIALAKQVPRP